jgi:hypothetical protein
VGIKERRFFLGDMGVDSIDDRFGSPLSLVNVVPAVVGGRRIEADSESILLRLNFGRIRRLGVEPTKLLGVIGVGSFRVTVDPPFVTVLFAAFATVASLATAAFA